MAEPYNHWSKLSPSEKENKEKRYNIIMERITALESSVQFNVEINFLGTYENLVVKWDDQTITPKSTGKYIVKDVTAGRYNIKASADDMEDYNQTIVCSVNKHTFDIRLTRNKGGIKVVPAEAYENFRVWVDEEDVTPTSGEYIKRHLTYGDHEVRVFGNGYLNSLDTVTVGSETEIFNKALTPYEIGKYDIAVTMHYAGTARGAHEEIRGVMWFYKEQGSTHVYHDDEAGCQVFTDLDNVYKTYFSNLPRGYTYAVFKYQGEAKGETQLVYNPTTGRYEGTINVVD